MLKERHRKLYYITITLFLVYLLFLIWVIMFKLEFSLAGLDQVREYNFIPFHYEDGHNIGFHFYEVIDNMLIFIPIGVYLCLVSKKMPLLGKAGFVFAISLALECSQYVLSVGRFDVTDLITNTAGGVIGIGVYLIGRSLFRDKVKADRAVAVFVNLVTVLLVGGTALILSLN
ncbi:MAG: VanZ family protein [Bacillota bacterium]|nr:VanZ family protein [Bacillota bacterium]